MNYRKMWYELKEQIIHDLQFHQKGDGQSVGESVYGQAKCTEVLDYMSKIEISQIIDKTYERC